MKTLSDSIAKYLEAGEYERELSPDTLKAYRIDLRQFSEFVEGEWPDRERLSNYVKHLNQSFAPRSVKRKLVSARTFYHDLEYHDVLSENPFDKLHIRIQSPKQLPRVIPIQIVHDLLNSAYEAYVPGCRNALRDIMVLELLFNTGLRISELCALNSESFLLNKKELRLLVYGKGRKERVLQVSTPELVRLAHTYCREFTMEIQEQGAILFNRRGRPLTPQSVRRIIQKYLKRVGFASNVAPHMFRHPNVKPRT